MNLDTGSYIVIVLGIIVNMWLILDARDIILTRIDELEDRGEEAN